MSVLGTQDYSAAPPPKQKKSWATISAMTFMIVLVVALFGAVISSSLKWLNIGGH
ncbi:MAG TPA: hypothetical protein VH437_15045 [Terriglobales bacterium]|jgi:hypothetical protein